MFNLPTEPVSFADTLARRKESARNTIREASVAELRALGTELNPDGTHPSVKTFSKFIEENRSERVFRGQTRKGMGFVISPKANEGTWTKTTVNAAMVVVLA